MSPVLIQGFCSIAGSIIGAGVSVWIGFRLSHIGAEQHAKISLARRIADDALDLSQSTARYRALVGGADEAMHEFRARCLVDRFGHLYRKETELLYSDRHLAHYDRIYAELRSAFDSHDSAPELVSHRVRHLAALASSWATGAGAEEEV